MKIVIGEWSVFGNDEVIKNIDKKYFQSSDEQNNYFNKCINHYFDNGYIECERAKFIDFDYIKNNENEINKEHICFKSWSKPFENNVDDILNYLIDNKEYFSNTNCFTFGNMNESICELSWIVQSDYEKFLSYYRNIKGLFIEGNIDLVLGKMDLPNLEILELQSTKISYITLNVISLSNLPNLKRLNLYIGEFTEKEEIRYIDFVLNNTDFSKLENLGFCNMIGNVFTYVLKKIFESKYAKQIKVLDISKSGSTDRDAQYIIDNIEKLENIKYIDISYNYFSQNFIDKLLEIGKKYNIEFDLSNNNEFSNEEDDITEEFEYYYCMGAFNMYLE